jgi:hypothetical protein
MGWRTTRYGPRVGLGLLRHRHPKVAAEVDPRPNCGADPTREHDRACDLQGHAVYGERVASEHAGDDERRNEQAHDPGALGRLPGFAPIAASSQYAQKAIQMTKIAAFKSVGRVNRASMTVEAAFACRGR